MKRGIRYGLLVSFAMLGLSAVSINAEPPATAPVAPSAADVQATIKRLQDDDFHVRLKASEQLKAMGKDILPTLKEALKTNTDPEVRAQVEGLIGDFEKPPVDESAVPQAGPQNGGFRQSSFSVSTTPNSRVLDISEPGRTIHIEDKPDGIYMKVVGQLDGKPATREYKANNAEDLKKKHPNAFALYQQRAGHGVGMINVVGGQGQMQVHVQINGGGAVNIGPANVNVRELVKVNQLQAKLLKEMIAQQVPAEQQKEVLDLVVKLRQGIPDLQKPEKEQEAQKREFERLGDLLRNKAAELKLGDIEAQLPAKPEKAKE